MDEFNQDVRIDVTEQMAEGMVPALTSRRERRAHKRAAEKAAQAPESTPSLYAEQDEQQEDPTKIFIPASKREAAAEKEETPEDDVKPYAPVKTAEPLETAEEPKGPDRYAQPEDDLFDSFDEKEVPASEEEKPAEEDEKKAEDTHLFFRKKSRPQDEDEDEDDEDEDDEDEDDEDDEDDYDKFDEDDDDDDDDDSRPLGYHVINFFKGLLEFVLVLLVLVLALNILDFYNIVSLDGPYNAYYDKAPAVFDTLFPSHRFKQTVETPTATEAPVGIEPASTPEVTADTAADAFNAN